MNNYTSVPCPPGYFCLEGDEPRLCPAGRMKDVPGAASISDCPLCRPGYFCPNDTENTQGIPCREKFECRQGASMEIDCTPGYFCNGTTGSPPICWGGYYCPNATDTPIPCEYPSYCPEGSNMTLTCPLGYMANNDSGIRDSFAKNCRICPAGYYGNHTTRLQCYLCPAGYYCPEGTGHGNSNPCPIGSYCPQGSGVPTPCPRGMYGKKVRAHQYGDCAPCPAQYYNDLLGQKACRPCGSSSSSPLGSATCYCKGMYRTYQKSDGACICWGGYHYYNEIDMASSQGNGEENCQQLVDVRCAMSEVRIAVSRECFDPALYDCSPACPLSGGSLDIDSGRYELRYHVIKK